MNSATDKPKIVVICGPTAIGKTTVAIDIAQKINGEIISADSMQIYRYMDIGTAKPTAEERIKVPHHMIDIVDPDEHFDAAQFSALARNRVREIQNRGAVPYVIGGTGLYIKSLIHGLFQSRPVDPAIRERLKAEAKKFGPKYLHQRLRKYDRDTAAKLHPNDAYRIIRALETVEATGKSISDYHREHKFGETPFHVLKIGLTIERDLLYDRINQRVDAMIQDGLLDEVKSLLRKGFSPDLKSMQSIGYRHMLDHLQTRLPWDECIRTMKRDTRRYAKRQLTWFNADSEIVWKEKRQIREITLLIKDFLRNSI